MNWSFKTRLQAGTKTLLCLDRELDVGRIWTAGGPRRMYSEGRLDVRRFDRFFALRQDEPWMDPQKDRQGNWKQARSYDVKGNGQTCRAITDTLVEASSEGKWDKCEQT